MLGEISGTVNARAFKPLPLCSAPENLLVEHFWSSRIERKPLSKQKCVLRYCLEGISETVNAIAFKLFAIVFSSPENLLVGISGALAIKGKPLSKQKCVLRIHWKGISETVNSIAFKPLLLCSAPFENLLLGTSGALAM